MSVTAPVSGERSSAWRFFTDDLTTIFCFLFVSEADISHLLASYIEIIAEVKFVAPVLYVPMDVDRVAEI